MHIPSAAEHNELLSSGVFARATWAMRDGSEQEPALLIKSHTLQLKYVSQSESTRLTQVKLPGDSLGYAVEIDDGGETPARLWSLADSYEEIAALAAITNGSRFSVHLYNEATVNVSSADFVLQELNHDATGLVEKCKPAKASGKKASEAALFDEFRAIDRKVSTGLSRSIDTTIESHWHNFEATLLRDNGDGLTISFSNQDEGGQQEELAQWLTDALQTDKVFRAPLVLRGPRLRELTDLLLISSDGIIVVESKALAVLARRRLPDRRTLADDLAKDLQKAVRQLKGAVRTIRSLAPIYDSTGSEIFFDRSLPTQAIILVPDLDLLGDADHFGKKWLVEHSNSMKAFLQLLDVGELSRVNQAAHMLAAKAETLTPLQCFDAHLWERFTTAVREDRPNFRFLLRFGLPADD